jgi:hypothetical protein
MGWLLTKILILLAEAKLGPTLNISTSGLPLFVLRLQCWKPMKHGMMRFHSPAQQPRSFLVPGSSAESALLMGKSNITKLTKVVVSDWGGELLGQLRSGHHLEKLVTCGEDRDYISMSTMNVVTSIVGSPLSQVSEHTNYFLAIRNRKLVIQLIVLTTAQRLNVPETVQINHEPIVATGEPTVS